MIFYTKNVCLIVVVLILSMTNVSSETSTNNHQNVFFNMLLISHQFRYLLSDLNKVKNFFADYVKFDSCSIFLLDCKYLSELAVFSKQSKCPV